MCSPKVGADLSRRKNWMQVTLCFLREDPTRSFTLISAASKLLQCQEEDLDLEVLHLLLQHLIIEVVLDVDQAFKVHG
jgi:hypothetical protein